MLLSRNLLLDLSRTKFIGLIVEYSEEMDSPTGLFLNRDTQFISKEKSTWVIREPTVESLMNCFLTVPIRFSHRTAREDRRFVVEWKEHRASGESILEALARLFLVAHAP